MTTPVPTAELRGVDLDYRSGPPWARQLKRAVSGVNLTVAPGETVGLVGQSGSGKTSVGRLLLGLLRPTAGAVLFEGRPIDDERRRHRGRLQAVLQNPSWSLNPRLRCETSVAEPLTVAGTVPADERHRRVLHMLEQVGLDPGVAGRFPHQLSGGQQQRVAIARALVSHPALVVFDEAVSALDVSVQAQILNLVRRLQDEVGFAALFISHDLAAARYVSHRVAVMWQSEIVEVADATALYHHADHPYTRSLFGLEPGAAGRH
ncbi:ABC transporter ATP-binding protein [Jiangella ureilytica]|uniref:ABC transporter ATP-binding protein n=1 Tax=Jiangella ureilytica TaxID=2530374 RepID=A0A4R4RTE4_9ACTN|nr:ATP-binding cassette domain-containing protein [Jiangella ureilytica]TDC53250.1 ABC transporter ATP-binding protein [Jiangella ureilytica]